MRLGDLDALKEHAKTILVGESINIVLGINLYKILEEIIDNAPTVEERPQGEWVKVKEDRMSIDMSGEIVTRYRCSECGRFIATLPSKLSDYPFCHCGADMKGGEEE